MEKVITFSIIVLIFISACSSAKQQPNHTSNKQSSIAFDTLEKNRIDTVVENILQKIRDNTVLQKIPYTVHDPTDTIYIYTVPDNGNRISLELDIKNGIDWSTFYVDKGELVYVRYRYFMEDSLSSRAVEAISYHKNGEIVYVNERGNELKDGQRQHPGSVRSLPYAISNRTPEEVVQDYNATWQLVLEQMKANDMLPKYLEKYMGS